MDDRNRTSVTVTTPTEREIVMTRTFDAPRNLLFEAYTNPDYPPRWMLGPPGWTMPVCEIDARPGGNWHFVWRKEDGTNMEMHGVYRNLTPPERIISTENWGGDWPETINTVTLEEQNGKTTLTTRILYPSQQARNRVFATGMTDGARLSFDLLDELLSSLVAQ